MENNNDTVKRFDNAARSWDEKPRRIELGRKVSCGIINSIQVGPDTNVLEFGCGTGLVGLEIAPHVGHLTAVDASGEMISVLKESAEARGISNITALHRLVKEPADLPGNYDLIFTSMVLHHIDDIPALFALFAAWCAPGERIALADLDAEDGSFHTDMTGVTHNGFDRAELISLLEAAGFTIEHVETVHEVIRGNGRTYPMFLIVGRR